MASRCSFMPFTPIFSVRPSAHTVQSSETKFSRFPRRLSETICSYHVWYFMSLFNKQLRKITKTRTMFSTDDSLFKFLFLAISNITAKRYGKPRNLARIISSWWSRSPAGYAIRISPDPDQLIDWWERHCHRYSLTTPLYASILLMDGKRLQPAASATDHFPSSDQLRWNVHKPNYTSLFDKSSWQYEAFPYEISIYRIFPHVFQGERLKTSYPGFISNTQK